jgi:hypothetical protein
VLVCATLILVLVCTPTRKALSVAMPGAKATFLFAFGSEGQDQGQLQSPRDLAFGSDGSLFVVDSLRVQVFSSEGKFLRRFAPTGSKPGQLSKPRGISIDNRGSGNVFITEAGENRVSAFKQDGTFLHTWGKKGTEHGQFNEPLGIACDGNGLVFVCDNENFRIQLFNRGGSFMSAFGGRSVPLRLFFPTGGFVGPHSIGLIGSDKLLVSDSGLRGALRVWFFVFDFGLERLCLACLLYCVGFHPDRTAHSLLFKNV